MWTPFGQQCALFMARVPRVHATHYCSAGAETAAPCHFTPCFTHVFRAKKRKINRERSVQDFQSDVDSMILKKAGCRYCCKRLCLRKASESDPQFTAQAAAWRAAWQFAPRVERQTALLLHLQNCKPGQVSEVSEVGRAHTQDGLTDAKVTNLVLTNQGGIVTHSLLFLGYRFCHLCFRRVTGVQTSRAAKACTLGLRSAWSGKRRRAQHTMDQMRGGLWVLIRQLHSQSPFAGDDNEKKWNMPFHRKVCLWRLVLQLHKDQGARGIFARLPMYSTFRRVLREREFKDVTFHRVVKIGRCPTCTYMDWKCRSVPPGLRAVWQNAMAKHQLMTLTQKRAYAADRAVAASDFPATELYLAHCFAVSVLPEPFN